MKHMLWASHIHTPKPCDLIFTTVLRGWFPSLLPTRKEEKAKNGPGPLSYDYQCQRQELMMPQDFLGNVPSRTELHYVYK